MTERLWEQDASLRVFEATVCSCTPDAQGWRIVLDRTAFFPEGGGQGADRGAIGDAVVLDVQTHAGVITHTTDRPLVVGACTTGHIDALRRLDQSQQHSGEHILSGILHQLHGYENVGFHIGDALVTVDVGGVLSPAQWAHAERLANEKIYENVPVHAYVPDTETLRTLRYRSKKEIVGAVRIVEIPGADVCACCGTHVVRTGEIGVIKVVSAQHYKGGMRLSVLCGARALAHYARTLDAMHEIGSQLSVKPDQAADAVARLLAERDLLRRLHVQDAERILAQQLTQGETSLFGDALPPAVMKRLCATQATRCTVFSREDAGWQFAMGAPAGMDVRALTAALCAAFEGRGGGKPTLTQGEIARGTMEELRAFIADHTKMFCCIEQNI